ncbi:MAG: filamentous hemagglutinin N-terminal domain-containing protein, partial [Magnetococcales bacterium]|nr:filamentous hemagglutinin N-terminal domain-containing protein [Magnetococcales bacterium]
MLSLAAAMAVCGSVNPGWAADTLDASTTGLPLAADMTINSRDNGADITYRNSGTGTRLDLDTNTKAIITWDHSTGSGFNIDSGKTLSIINDSNNFTVLNVVSGGSGTTIAGTISTLGANASVIILDPNGITISDGASLNDITNLGLFTQDTSTGASNLNASALDASAANFGLTFNTLSNTDKNVTIGQNIGLQSGGDLVIRADGAVTINDGSASGQIQAQDITITANGAVAVGSNSSLQSAGTLAVSTATNQNATLRTTGATTLGDINVGTGVLSITATGQLSQGSSATITANDVVISTTSAVGTAETTGLNLNSTNIQVDNGSSATTGQAIYINAVNGATVMLEEVKGSTVTLGNPGGTAGTGTFQGESSGVDIDITATTLTIGNDSGLTNIKTAVSNLALSSAGSSTISNTGVLSINTGSTTQTGSTIQITNDQDITIAGTLDAGTSKNTALSLITPASKTVTIADDASSSAGNIRLSSISIVADNVIVSDTTSGHIYLDNGGTASIRAPTAGRSISLGTHPGTGLDLNSTELQVFGTSGSDTATLVVGASSDGSNAGTGAIVVTANVSTNIGLSLYGSSLAFTGGGITLGSGTYQPFAATITGAVTSAANSTADITASTITIDATGSVGTTTATEDLDIDASGLVNITAGASGSSAAETINVRSLGTTLSLGQLQVRDSVTALNAGDAITLSADGEVTDGNAATANLTAQTVNLRGATTNNTAAATAFGTSADTLEVSKATTGLTIRDYNAGTVQDATATTTFEGVHLTTDSSLTLANDLYTSSTGGTGVSLLVTGTGTFNNSGKTIASGNTSDVTISAADITLSGTSVISTAATGTVSLTDTSGGMTLGEETAAATNDLTAAELEAISDTPHLSINATNVAVGSTGLTIHDDYDANNVWAGNLTSRNVTLSTSGDIVGGAATVNGAIITLSGDDIGTSGTSVDVTANTHLITTSTNAAYISSTGALALSTTTVGGVLDIDSTGAVTNVANAAISAGATTITTSNDAVTLGDQTGDTVNFSSVTLSTGTAAISIVEDSAMDIAGITNSGTVSLTAGGAITDSGNIAAGAVTLSTSAANGAITLDMTGHAVTSWNASSGTGNIQIVESDAMLIAG